jgi:hypothetical protein
MTQSRNSYRDTGELSLIREFAAEAADNAARIAAILAYVETRSASTPEHINRAAELMQYYLQTLIQRTQEATQITGEHEVRELADWVRQNGGELHANNFNKLPAAYRKAKTARALLALLVDYGHALVTFSGPNGKARAWKLREGRNNV